MHPGPHQQWQCNGTEHVDAGVSRVIGDAAQCDGERLGGVTEGGRKGNVKGSAKGDSWGRAGCVVV